MQASAYTHPHGASQEDAHEYLRCLVDLMQRHCVGRCLGGKPPQATTMRRIFNGELSSTVTCSRCRRHSTTTEPFEDLSLEINHDRILSVVDALDHFCAAETLSGSNKCVCSADSPCFVAVRVGSGIVCADIDLLLSHVRYRCERCKCEVDAVRRIGLCSLPPTVVLHLKRFDARSKVNKHIEFPRVISMTRWCVDANSKVRSCCNVKACGVWLFVIAARLWDGAG